MSARRTSGKPHPADSGGSHGWARQEQILGGVSIGAPPDLLSTGGQNWGLAAFSPAGLRAHGIPTTVRDTRGRDIDGACGQLAAVSS